MPSRPPSRHDARVEPLLSFAAELERRDAAVGRALEDVEALQAAVDEIRRRAGLAAGFLEALPERRAQHEDAEQGALAARAEAETALRLAEERVAAASKDDDRLAAERARQDAVAAAAAAERWLTAARDRLAADDAELAQWTEATDELAGRAAELTARLPDVPAPAEGLAGTIEWASQARGALLLERSNRAREREAIIREANELTASVLGEPLASAAVAGLRERLARDVAR